MDQINGLRVVAIVLALAALLLGLLTDVSNWVPVLLTVAALAAFVLSQRQIKARKPGN